MIMTGGAMAAQERKQRPAKERATEEVSEEPVSSEKGETLKAEIDELLDEIDEVLESNAEDFVKGYIQKGGE